MKTEKSIDSVTLTIINNYLVNTCREMGLAMMKTSYSSIFNEGLDFSCVIFDRDGEMVGYAEFCPAQIGAILYTMQWTIAEIGIENHNDPYRGGCHMPEHTVIQAVYHDGELYGFIGNIAHVTEIGGKAVGGFAADAKEVYQEGLRLPPVKIIREGEPVEDIWKIILENHRTPRTSWGDFHAMLGSLNVAERRLHQLLDRYGFDEILTAGKQLMDYSETRMRAEIRDIPNGEYQFDDWIENDGVVPDKQYRINCTVIVEDENILFDYTGSSPQARGPCNCTYGVTASATFNAMLNITDQTIPRNSGCAGLRSKCVTPRSQWRRQFRDPRADRRCPVRLPIRCCAGARRCSDRCQFMQFPFRRDTPKYRSVLRKLPHRRLRLGWQGNRRRQSHTVPNQRKLPEYPGRSLRDTLSLADEKVSHRRRFGRARSAARRVWQRKGYRSTCTGNYRFELYGQA
ncbi:hydantoinase B/oxoprolinase family protein [Candidatus Poribacteria bacterium]|nr:hydantoinase B/oxoprolinase family protein [Candidatus Poribacteria bacterium]